MVLPERNNKIINLLKPKALRLSLCIYHIFHDPSANYYCHTNFEVTDYNKLKGRHFYPINPRAKSLFCISLNTVKGKVDMYYAFKMNWNSQRFQCRFDSAKK